MKDFNSNNLSLIFNLLKTVTHRFIEVWPAASARAKEESADIKKLDN
jgi:hypothetical protein